MLHGFLGLAGYYQKFINNFGTIAAPLIQLLQKEGFTWSEVANHVFAALKDTVVPVLQLPDFTKWFIVEYDTSSLGFGAILHQGNDALAFFSNPISPLHVRLAAYEHKLICLVHAVRHWQPYLWGCMFIVCTDHYSLKFLLDQHLSTIPQHQWVNKLFGFDFTVEYKSGHLNIVADALSHHKTEASQLCAISGPQFSMFLALRCAALIDPVLVALND